MDRRIVRTRTLVLHAILDITSSTAPSAKIKVVDLCEKAGINKSTFYLHYTDIDDCVEKCTGYMIDKAVELASKIDYEAVATDPTSATKAIVKFVETNRETIVKLSNSTMYNKVVDRIAEAMIAIICENNNINMNMHHQYIKVSFLVYGTIGAVKNSLAFSDSVELQNILAGAIKRKNM